MAAAILRSCVGNCRRIIPTLLRNRSFSVIEGYSRLQPAPLSQTQRVFPTISRWQSSDAKKSTVDEKEETTLEEWEKEEEAPKQRWWEWWLENYFEEYEEHPSPYSCEEEKNERQAMLERVQEMYFAKPPVMPDLDFYKESFELLIKYNDRPGVIQLWGMMCELKVEPDEELTERVEKYLEESDPFLF